MASSNSSANTYVIDDFNIEHAVTLRLNISCQSPYTVGWTLAIKMHGERIDGIDWHAKFDDPSGVKHSGWHRHGFDTKLLTAMHLRTPVTVMDKIASKRDFLIRGLSEMRVLLSGRDYGQDELLFSETIPDGTFEQRD